MGIWKRPYPSRKVPLTDLGSVTSEKDERIKNRGPGELMFVDTIEERTDSDEISGQHDFSPDLGKNADRPITDQLRKDLGSETRIGAANEFHIRRRLVQTSLGAKKIAAIIEPAIPHHPILIRQAVRLRRFGGGVGFKGSVHQCRRSSTERGHALRSIGTEKSFDSSNNAVEWLSVEITNPELDTHQMLLAIPLAAIQHGIGLSHAYFVADNNSLDFHPGVGPKRQMLGPDHEFGGETQPPQKTYGDCRPL
jgi:hypothetical protein